MPDKRNFCVIMAGGIGSRFWPMSRSSFPKQFHDILGTGETLIQMTFRRFLKVCPAENIYVVTNERYCDLVKEQLPELTDQQVLGEPMMRNTAPCIAYANFKIARKNPDALIVVTPADHLVTNEEEFTNILELSFSEAKNSDSLVTLGIKPTRPDTGYGYIQFEDLDDADDRVKRVKTFTEKPNAELAQAFLDSGDFSWNSGIFIWSLKNIQDNFQKHLPEMYEAFGQIAEELDTPSESEAIRRVYVSCENISIDYGIMENAEHVRVILSNFGWSDLGTWGSLYTHIPRDNDSNAVVGKNVRIVQSANNMVFNENDKLLVVHGLEDMVVVNTDDVLLIIPKSEEQKIKNHVTALRQEGKSNVL